MGDPQRSRQLGSAPATSRVLTHGSPPAITAHAKGSTIAARSGASADDEHDPEGVTLSSEWSRLTGLAEAAASGLLPSWQAARAYYETLNAKG